MYPLWRYLSHNLSELYGNIAFEEKIELSLEIRYVLNYIETVASCPNISEVEDNPLE